MTTREQAISLLLTAPEEAVVKVRGFLAGGVILEELPRLYSLSTLARYVDMTPQALINMGIHKIAEGQAAGRNPRYEHERFKEWWAKTRAEKLPVRSRPMGGGKQKGEPATHAISPSARNGKGKPQRLGG